MTERTWPPQQDDATGSDAPLILAQVDEPLEQAPQAPLEPTGPQEPTELVPEVTEAAPEDADPTVTPQGLVEVEGTPGEPEAAATAQAAPEVAATEVIEIEPPADGERRVVELPDGAVVSLTDSAFDPSVATYRVSGTTLTVSLANGAVVEFPEFFSTGREVPIQLSVLGGPATPAEQLLTRAEVLAEAETVTTVEPTAPPPQPVEPQGGSVHGGGANFSQYDQGNIGPGLDPLGPLGPTALGLGLDVPELFEGADAEADDGGDGEVVPPPPPDTVAPEVELRPSISATIGEQSGPGFNPASTPVSPLRGAGQAIPDAEVNNVDQRNLTLDIDREVFVRFIDDNSFSIDSLFVHEIGPKGEIQNVRLVFDGVNKPGDPLSELRETPLGTEFSLGTVPAGTELGLILVNDGLRLNDFDAFDGGRFEVFNRLTGEPATIFDNHDTSQPWQQPRVVHVADDGTVTPVIGSRNSFTADASQFTPNSNRLNPDGKGQFVSGWDEKEGLLAIGVEDSFGSDSDRDFADLVFGVRFGSPLEKVLVIDDLATGLGATITDADSTSMVAASITLAGLTGDSLALDPSVLAGTGITLTQVSETQIELAGESSIENYEAVISAATLEIDLEAARVGDRVVSVTVEDPDGNTGDASTTFEVDDNLLTGPGDGSGDDAITGTSSSEPGSEGRDVVSGRAGDDDITALSGNDFGDGGDGSDRLVSRGPGDNTFRGGPQPDEIILSLFSGTDTVVITGLSDAKDTIRNFDATDGDKLDLSLLFRDSDVTEDNLDQFLQTDDRETGVMVRADLDGPGTDQRFVDVAFLSQPTGVTGATDPSTYIITGDSEAQTA